MLTLSEKKKTSCGYKINLSFFEAAEQSGNSAGDGPIQPNRK